MSNLRQAAQQALEALEEQVRRIGPEFDDPFAYGLETDRWALMRKAIPALRAALAEPEQTEQKVWCDCGDSIEPDSGAKCGNCVAADSAGPEQEPVAWVECDGELVWNNREAAIGRNLYTAPTPQPEQKQEPVAWMYDFLNPDDREEVIRNWVTQSPDDIEREKGFNVRPLYTAPIPRKPLPTIEIIGMYNAQYDPDADDGLGFARAIERAHGIGEQQ